jgi:hypothetical protein
MTATLAKVLEHLDIVRVLHDLNATVTGIVVHDPLDPPRPERGEVVLGVGVGVGDPATPAMLDDAAAGGAVAVIVKSDTDVPVDELARHAKNVGVALLAIEHDVAWGQLYSLLRTATASLGVEHGPGPGGVAVGDLFTLANAVAAMVGGPTTIENPESTILAYSSLDEPIDEPRRDAILGRRVPPRWLRRLQEDGVFRQLWMEEGPVRIMYDEPGFATRLAIAVRAGGQILGSLWVAEGRAPLGPEAENAMREAARIAALHLVRHQMADDLERRRESELLRAVLEGRRPPHLMTELLGRNRSTHLTVIGFELPDAGPADLAVHGDQAVSLIDLYTQAYRHQAVSTLLGNVVYMVVGDDSPPEPDRLRRLATAVIERSSQSLRIALRAGIGRTVDDSGRVLSSRADADLVLDALSQRDDDMPVARLADVAATVVLLRLREIVAQEPKLLAGKLDTLAALDGKGQTHYLETLQAYLDTLGDIPSAAASLGVHTNTYRYRLRRLVALGAIDMDDPVERLVIHLQLHLRGS